MPGKVKRVFGHFLLMPAGLDLRCCNSAGCSVLLWYSSFPANHNKTRRTKGHWWSKRPTSAAVGHLSPNRKTCLSTRHKARQAQVALGNLSYSQRFTKYLAQEPEGQQSVPPRTLNQTGSLSGRQSDRKFLHSVNMLSWSKKKMNMWTSWLNGHERGRTCVSAVLWMQWT